MGKGGEGGLLNMLYCVDAGADYGGFAEETHFEFVGLRVVG